MIFPQKIKNGFALLICLISFIPSHTLSAKNSPPLQCDPPNWWTGMAMNEISLLVRGANFASVKEVKSNSPAAVILSWKLNTSGCAYKFHPL